MSDFSSYGLVDIADGIRNGNFSSREITEWSLSRLKSLGYPLNAVARIDHDHALKKADQMDRQRSRGESNGVLHGVPLAHKDLFDMTGFECLAGSVIRKGRVADKTASIIRRMDQSGQVNVGSLQMAEFALSPTGFNAHYGSGKNPWNPDYISGGSSTGSGIAVAGRMVFGSIGGDTGGSIRLPAAMCGITGLKTSFRLLSSEGALPLSESLDCFGPLAQTASDCKLMLDAAVDASAAPVSYMRSTDRLRKENSMSRSSDLSSLRVRVLRGFFADDVDPEIMSSVNETVEVFKSLGAQISEVDVPKRFIDELNALSSMVLGVEAAAMHRRDLAVKSDQYSEQVRSRIEQGFLYPAVRYAEALMMRNTLLEKFEQDFMRDSDVAVLPMMKIKTPTIEATTVGNQADVLNVVAQVGIFARWVNYLGLPALSLPCGFDSNGLPIATQLVGRLYDELLLLAIGKIYQSSTSWHKKVPRMA